MLTLVALLALSARPARADEKADARALFTEATRNYDLNDYARALTLFKQAYLKFEDPVFLYNIGQCERQLGEKQSAVKSYRSYLRKSPDAPNREAVRRLIAQLEAAIAEESKAQHSPPEGPMHPEGGAQASGGTAPAGGSTNLTTTTTTTSSSSSGADLTAQHQPSEKPVYKKPWFWGVVGGVAAVVVAGVVVGVVVGGATHDPGAPSIGVVK